MNPWGVNGLWCGGLVPKLLCGNPWRDFGWLWGPGDQKVENWPVAVVWASKALFGVLGSEPLAVLILPGFWHGILGQ